MPYGCLRRIRELRGRITTKGDSQIDVMVYGLAHFVNVSSEVDFFMKEVEGGRTL